MIPNLERSWLWGLVGDEEAARPWEPERVLGHMRAFEAAYVRALGNGGSLEPARAERLARIVERAPLDPAALLPAARRDGVPVNGLVAQLRAATSEDADVIHRGATSQDVVDTALALTLRETTTLVLARLADVTGRLEALTGRFGTRTLVGRTRMQAAEPIAVAERLGSWHAPLLDHAARLTAHRPRVERLQFGGALGNRAASGGRGDAIAHHLARALELADPPRAWHTARDPIVEHGGQLALVTGTLGKLGQDVCLMSQQGIDEIALAGGGGSSAMSHKRNPVEAELLVTLARFNATQVSGLHHAMVHEQERSGAAWTLEWLILPQIVMATARALGATSELLGRIERIGSAASPD